MDNDKQKEKKPYSGKDMDLEEIERRKAAIRARRRKRRQAKIAICVSMALVVVLAVILVVYGVSVVVKHVSNSGGQDVVQTEAPVETEDAATEVPEETEEAGGVYQETLNNTIIENVSSLSSESIGWGYGTSRDDLNRPLDAVNYQEKYGSYSAYFVRTSSDDKVIYLTMDEGYENGYTSTILDVLAETDTKIVFFITQPYAESNPDLVQRMIDEGHVVGNHSVNHPSAGMPSLTIEEMEAEITGLHEYMQENFNYTMWLFRPPTGAFSEQSLAVANNLNYISVFWSFAHYDYDVENQPDTEEALQKCLDSLHPGAIYLLHAVSETNTAILRDFINGAKEQGYTFELIPASDW